MKISRRPLFVLIFFLFSASLLLSQSAAIPNLTDIDAVEQTRTLYVNSTFIMMGTMFLYFSDVFQSLTGELAELFEGEGEFYALDERLKALPAEILSPILRLRDMLQEAFDGLEEDNFELYERMFRHPSMASGLAIAGKYTLPESFKPLYSELSDDEVRRYIAVLASPQILKAHPDHPVVLMYQDLGLWLQSTGEELQKDPEIAAFFLEMQ